MAIKRQGNFLGQQRLDVPHLKSIESAVANDFDLLAGKMLSGKAPLILKGFTVSTSNTIGTPVDSLQLNVAGGILMHYAASEAGTIFSVADNIAAEVLNGLNGNVLGSFTAGVTNYIGLDLIRGSDTSTSDLVQFYDVNTKKEVPQTVPLARTLQYKIIISTQNFTVSSNVLPIAKVVTDIGNLIISITDARRLMFRLGSGGDIVNATAAYPWGLRTENNVSFTGGSDSFTGEDKSLNNLKSWMDMAMTSIWEARGGDFWYSPANRDNVKLTLGQPTIAANNDNFFFPLISVTATNATRTGGNTVTVTFTAHGFVNGQVLNLTSAVTDANFPIGTKIITSVADADHFTYTEIGANVSNAQTLKYSSLVWSGLGLAFENSTGWFNTITDSAATGMAFPDGYALYTDLTRSSNATVSAVIAPLVSLGYSTIPGRRIIIAWRIGDLVFVKDKAFEVGRFQNPVATASVLGIVKLSRAASTPLAPIVISDTGGTIASTAASGNIGLTVSGDGTGSGILASGGATAANAIEGIAFSTGSGVIGLALGSGHGLSGISSGSGSGVRGSSGGTGNGVTGIGGATGGAGVSGTATAAGTNGGIFVGKTSGAGVLGTGDTTGPGVRGVGGATNGNGVSALGTGSGAGVNAQGGATNGIGVSGQGVGSGYGIYGAGDTTGSGVRGDGGNTNGSYGGLFSSLATNGNGVSALGTGNGNGINSTGGPSAGAGVRGTAGTAGLGIEGIGTGALSHGVKGTGGAGGGSTGGTGVVGLGGTGTSGGLGGFFVGGATNARGIEAYGVGTGVAGFFKPVSNTAIQSDGNIDLAGANPTVGSDGYRNQLTQDNMCKAWAVVQLNTTGPVILSSFNIASVAVVGNICRVGFSTTGQNGQMATPYVVNVNGEFGATGTSPGASAKPRHVAPQNCISPSFDFVVVSADYSTTVNPNDSELDTILIHISVHGRQ